MPEPAQPFVVASVQATPVVLDRDRTVEKACGLIAEAAKEGARIIVFPEAFVPTYPDWVWVLPPGQAALHRELYSENRWLSRALRRRSSAGRRKRPVPTW
jgi:predicted amidohydrolase